MQLIKSLIDQAGQLAGTPLMDPSKNPQIAEQAQAAIQNNKHHHNNKWQKHKHIQEPEVQTETMPDNLTPEEQDSSKLVRSISSRKRTAICW